MERTRRWALGWLLGLAGSTAIACTPATPVAPTATTLPPTATAAPPTPTVAPTATVPPAPSPTAASTSPTASPVAKPAAQATPEAGMVPVGPLQFNLECAGTGEPPVILEAGSGDSLVVWDPIAATVGGFTRTCAYDRPGLGHSPPRASQAPVTADQQAGDLHALLEAAGLHGPYVLVGHSHGATIVRVYAGKYPGDVAGLVLVDPMIQSLMHDTRLDGFDLLDLDASREQVQAAHLPDVPLVVLTAGGDPNGGSPEGIRDHEAIAAQVPRGRHIVVPGAPHTIHSAQPKAVVDAIREVVEAARTGGR